PLASSEGPARPPQQPPRAAARARPPAQGRSRRRLEELHGPAAAQGHAVEAGVGVDGDGVADEVEEREVGDRVGVEPALGEVDALLLDEVLEPVDLALFEADRLDDATGEAAVLDLEAGVEEVLDAEALG